MSIYKSLKGQLNYLYLQLSSPECKLDKFNILPLVEVIRCMEIVDSIAPTRQCPAVESATDQFNFNEAFSGFFSDYGVSLFCMPLLI